MMQLYDGSQYWGEWCCGVRHGWGVQRTIDGHSEYRGEFRNGAYCGLGVMRQGGVSKCGHWVQGELVLRQRLSASALFAARDAAIRAGLIRTTLLCLWSQRSCALHLSFRLLHPGTAAECCFPDEARATAEAIICVILAATERQCAIMERRRKHFVPKIDLHADLEADSENLKLIRSAGDEPEFEYWGYSLTTSFLNERTHKLEKKALPHLCGRLKSQTSGWVYRGQFDTGNMHGMGGVVWSRLDRVGGELRNVSETYIGQWQNGRREGLGVFSRSDGTSDQGIWNNNNLVDQFVLDIQHLLTFQAAVNQGEAIAMKAEARVNAAAAAKVSGSHCTVNADVQSKLPALDDQDAFDPLSPEYITSLMELLITNSQHRQAAHLAKIRQYDSEVKRAEDKRQHDAQAFQAYSAALAGSSDSDDEGPVFCTLGTAFFASRVYYGDSPVNVGIEFDRASRPSSVKEVL